MWQILTSWLTGRTVRLAVRLVWAFLSNLVKARADDPRLATFIKDQIVFLQATSGMDGKDKLFAVANEAMTYAKNLGLDIAYSTILTLSAALFDEVAPKLSEMVDTWWAVKTKGVAL